MTKQELRQVVARRRADLTPEWIAAASRTIQERVAALKPFAEAGTVCGYLAMAGEVRTDWLFDRIWETGRKLCVPAYSAQRQAYGLAWLRRDTERVRGHGGVSEPARPVWCEVSDVNLMLVPGLAFDRQGGRVGHGRGHYDRLLALRAPSSCFTVGLAFGFQVFDRVPVDAHDVRLDVVITD